MYTGWQQVRLVDLKKYPVTSEETEVWEDGFKLVRQLATEVEMCITSAGKVNYVSWFIHRLTKDSVAVPQKHDNFRTASDIAMTDIVSEINEMIDVL